MFGFKFARRHESSPEKVMESEKASSVRAGHATIPSPFRPPFGFPHADTPTVVLLARLSPKLLKVLMYFCLSSLFLSFLILVKLFPLVKYFNWQIIQTGKFQKSNGKKIGRRKMAIYFL